MWYGSSNMSCVLADIYENKLFKEAFDKYGSKTILAKISNYTNPDILSNQAIYNTLFKFHSIPN